MLDAKPHEYIRAEYKRRNDHGGKRGDQNGARGDIFGLADQRMMLLCGGVGQKFDCRVQCLGRPHRGASEDEQTPLNPGHAKQVTRSQDNDCGDGMNPGVVLRDQCEPNPTSRISETAKSRAELESTFHG